MVFVTRSEVRSSKHSKHNVYELLSIGFPVINHAQFVYQVLNYHRFIIKIIRIPIGYCIASNFSVCMSVSS